MRSDSRAPASVSAGVNGLGALVRVIRVIRASHQRTRFHMCKTQFEASLADTRQILPVKYIAASAGACAKAADTGRE